jgi:hypothetical protein
MRTERFKDIFRDFVKNGNLRNMPDVDDCMMQTYDANITVFYANITVFKCLKKITLTMFITEF